MTTRWLQARSRWAAIAIFVAWMSMLPTHGVEVVHQGDFLVSRFSNKDGLP